MTKSAIVFLAQGTEEMEFTIVYDILVRGGVKVTSVYVPSEGASASPPDGVVVASRGVKLGADTTLEALGDAVDAHDAFIVPGGAGGATTIAQHPAVLALLKAACERGKVVGMVCAGTLAALHAQLGLGGPITSHPSVADKLSGAYDYRAEAVVTSTAAAPGTLVTSRGPGTSMSFALALLEHLEGKEVRDKVEGPLIVMHL